MENLWDVFWTVIVIVIAWGSAPIIILMIITVLGIVIFAVVSGVAGVADKIVEIKRKRKRKI